MIDPSVVDRGDGPGVAVADRLTAARDEAAVVAAGRDHLSDMGDLAATKPCRNHAVEVTGGMASGLDGVVDRVDVVVRRRHDGDASAGVVVIEPGGGQPVEVLVEGAGNDPAVGLVGVEATWVTASQLQRRGSFPGVGETVQAFEVLDTAVDAQLGEQAAPADTLQLSRVTHQGDPPPVPVGEGHELVQRRRGQHAGLVHHQRRARRELELGQRWSVGALVFVEQLGDGVGGDAGVALHGARRLRCRRQREHDSTMRVDIRRGGGEHAGLAGASGADHQDEPVVAGDGSGGVGLQRVETVPDDRGGWCGRVGLGGHRPRDDRFFLGEDHLGREAGCGRLDPHRPAIRAASGHVAGRVEVDKLGDDVVGRPLQGGGPAASRLLGHGTLQVADRLQHISPGPRRALLRHRLHHVGDDERVGRDGVGGGGVDAGVEQLGGPAGVGGFGLPPCRQIGGAVSGLAGPCVSGCFTGQRGAFPP